MVEKGQHFEAKLIGRVEIGEKSGKRKDREI